MSFSDFYEAIASPDLKAVAWHWNEARGTRSVPEWPDISPKRIVAQLPMIWFYTYEPQSDTFTGRLSGEHISSIFGRNFRGVPMSELYPTKDFPAMFARSKRVITQPAFFRGYGMVFRHMGHVLTGERIIMPLAPSETAGGGILGATFYPRTAGNGQPSLDFEEESESWFGSQHQGEGCPWPR